MLVGKLMSRPALQLGVGSSLGRPVLIDRGAQHAHTARWNLRNTFLLGAGASSPKSPQTLLPHSWAEGGGEIRSDSFLWNVVPEEGCFIQQEPSCSKTVRHTDCFSVSFSMASPQLSIKLKDSLIWLHIPNLYNHSDL